MDIFDFEKKVAFKTYENRNNCYVNLTFFVKERDGGSIITLFPDGSTITSEYNIKQKNGAIYFRVSEEEYVVEIKGMNELTITAFDLIKDEKVFDTFIIVNNVS
jgi:hypothetical protein